MEEDKDWEIVFNFKTANPKLQEADNGFLTENKKLQEELNELKESNRKLQEELKELKEKNRDLEEEKKEKENMMKCSIKKKKINYDKENNELNSLLDESFKLYISSMKEHKKPLPNMFNNNQIKISLIKWQERTLNDAYFDRWLDNQIRVN